MRTYRFVRFLGDRVEEAGRRVAERERDATEPEERLPGGGADPHEAVRRELPRAVADGVDGARKGSAEIRATALSVDGTGRDRADTNAHLGVVVHASVPDFDQVSALVAKTVDARALTDPAYSLAETNESRSLDELLAVTADAFVFVVGAARVHVVPAQSVVALTDPQRRQRPHRNLYSRQLGRTVEEFVEGFVGDATVAPRLSQSDSRAETEKRLRDWATEHDLGQVLFIQVTASTRETAATLQDFV